MRAAIVAVVPRVALVTLIAGCGGGTGSPARGQSPEVRCALRHGARVAKPADLALVQARTRLGYGGVSGSMYLHGGQEIVEVRESTTAVGGAPTWVVWSAHPFGASPLALTLEQVSKRGNNATWYVLFMARPTRAALAAAEQCFVRYTAGGQ
jgi:hypothetical protein